ncbi:integrase core domain-containing protein [Bradyrhizobium sp. SZCCHNG3015]|uniref:integrase core domain-containing protein n=1 Tax=unclassified Bradyrhizobium TaxID=2631580 RepID=UPI0039657FA7
MDRSEPCRLALHRAGQTHAERLHRELQRSPADEQLNETLFTSLAQARVALRCWRTDYNDARPHSQLGWKTPSEFAATCNPRRDLELRYAESSAPAPAATTAQMGTSNRPNELRSG